MEKYEQLRYMAKYCGLVDSEKGKQCIIDYKTKKVYEDRRYIKQYKFAFLWTAAINHKEYFGADPTTGKFSLHIASDIDSLYDNDTFKGLYQTLESSIKCQLSEKGNIEPVRTLSDMELFSDNYKHTNEIVNRLFYNQACADIMKKYGEVLCPYVRTSNEPAKYIDDPYNYFESYYTDKALGKKLK